MNIRQKSFGHSLFLHFRKTKDKLVLAVVLHHRILILLVALLCTANIDVQWGKT